MREYWRDILGYEGLYQVSDFGRIRTTKRKVQSIKGFYYIKESKLLRTPKDSHGYPCLCLSKNKAPKRHKVHRLMAFAFMNNPENKPCINHKDGHKENNKLWNIEWCTYSENTKHAIHYGLR